MNVPYHILFLRAELQRRLEKDPKYSLRVFAHALNVHPSAMSRMLQCKQELSVRCCIMIVPKMILNDQEKHDFLLSVAEEKMHSAAKLLARSLKVAINLPAGFNA